MAEAFSQPFMYWVGMNTAPRLNADDLTAFNTFYNDIHVPEVLASNPGFVRGWRYELLQPDPRGDFGPRWLAIYEMDAEDSAYTYSQRNDGPPVGRPSYTQGPVAWRESQTRWRMIWRRMSSAGNADEPPHSIFMVGMNVPPDTTAADLEAFNTFYTDTHVPEVMAHRGYHRGTRYQLYRAFRHPEPGCPRFCAIYEADEATTDAAQQALNAPRSGPSPLSSGPPAWEKHDTLWRLVYRRIDL